MIKLLVIFLFLFLSVWMGITLNQHPGYLIIAWHHWTIETTLSVALIGILITFFIFHTVLLSIHWLTQAPQLWRHFKTKHKAQIAQEKTRKGLIEFSEGHWLQAKNHLINALPNAETPLLNYLTAARAAQELGDSQLRDHFLREAQQSMPEAKIAVELTQAQLQMANKQWEQALATLRHLHDMSPRHPYVLKLLLHLYKEVKDWPQLITLLPDLKRNHIVSEIELKHLEKHAYMQHLIDLIKQNQLIVIQEKIKAIPKWLLQDTEIVYLYADYLIKNEQFQTAEAQLRQCLQKQFDSNLIHLYGQILPPIAQIKFVESLLKTEPHSHAVYLCLGRICQTSELFGKAQQYYEKSIEIHATAEAYHHLGQLLIHNMNNEQGALQAYQRGLALALT